MKTLITILTTLLISTNIFAAETQTNVSGSNTSIEGGYTGVQQPTNQGLPLLQLQIVQVTQI